MMEKQRMLKTWIFFGFGSGLVKKASGWVGFLGISWHITGRRFISRGSTGCQNLWRYERYIISYLWLWCITEAGISSTYLYHIAKILHQRRKNVVIYLTHFLWWCYDIEFYIIRYMKCTFVHYDNFSW